jgi:teichuronic acid biosynthesis glycosyltransferase TuaC
MEKMEKLKILGLSSVYPNPKEPVRGVFVRARLQAMAEVADIKVIAPVALLDYANSETALFGSRGVPRKRWDGVIEVFHPRWVYPPGGLWLNAPCLAVQMLSPLLRLRKAFPFDLIDAHFGYPEGIAAWLLASACGCPFTVTLRGNETMHGEKPVVRRWLRWTLRRAALVITVSARLADFAAALGVRREKIAVVPNGVDASIFYPRDRAHYRRKHGISPSGKVILSAGYLIETKGHHHVVAALKALENRGIAAELLVAGTAGRGGRYEQEIKRLVSTLGLEQRVRFLGQVAPDALAEIMAAVDVLCLCSAREGWPNVVHEALACGTPVIATDVGGIRKLIASESYGHVIPINDQVALEDALYHTFQVTWDHASIAAWAQQRSWRTVAADVLAEFSRIVAAETKSRLFPNA